MNYHYEGNKLTSAWFLSVDLSTLFGTFLLSGLPEYKFPVFKITYPNL